MHINNIRYYIVFTHQHPDCIGANVTVYRHFIEDLSPLPTCLFSVNTCVPHIIVILGPLVRCPSVTPPGNVYINEQLVNRLPLCDSFSIDCIVSDCVGTHPIDKGNGYTQLTGCTFPQGITEERHNTWRIQLFPDIDM